MYFVIHKKEEGIPYKREHCLSFYDWLIELLMKTFYVMKRKVSYSNFVIVKVLCQAKKENELWIGQNSELDELKICSPRQESK
jgi:hypothetical protein